MKIIKEEGKEGCAILLLPRVLEDAQNICGMDQEYCG